MLRERMTKNDYLKLQMVKEQVEDLRYHGRNALNLIVSR